MATKKKMLQAAAGSATGGAGLDITEVFSTYLYIGNNSTQTITNGIDLAGEGGLTWIKGRDFATGNLLFDTERGALQRLISNATNASENANFTLTSFNSDGFSVGDSSTLNGNLREYASWTFRKAPKFFDVVTWSGNGTAGRAISHDLGSVPGMIVVKNLTTSGSGFSDWRVWHRSESSKTATLNTTAAFSTTDAASKFGNGSSVVQPTSTEFTVAADYDVNRSGEAYVAYLFAHNDGDGGFGPDGDADIIKCGSYTGGGSSDVDVNLGFEPQFVIVKGADISRGWVIGDIMRGAPVGSNGQRLFANTSDAETTEDTVFTPTPTGFKVKANSGGTVNDSGLEYIYMAIRRGPLAQPESGTEVFDIATRGAVSGEPGFRSDTGVVDMALVKTVNTSSDWSAKSRLTQGKYLVTNSSAAETSLSYAMFDYMNGHSAFDGTNSNTHSWMWKRSPGFCDVVAYSGNSTAGRTVSHNLGVVPEMMWVKSRSKDEDWVVYHEGLGSPPEENYIYLNHNRVKNFDGNTIRLWNHTSPTDSEFTLGIESRVNLTGHTYIAYLFATLPGVSKVGSYTGNGSSQTIDCGFTSGARFVLIKRTDSTGDWYVWDTERGIVAGNDPYLELNTTDAEVTSTDWVDPDNSGFIVNGTTINASSAEYIFYAVS